MEVVPYSGEGLEEFSALFDGFTHGRYCADWTLDIEAARRLERDNFFAYVQANRQTSLLVKEGGQVRGALGMRRSEWDSRFWGFPCATIEHLYIAKMGGSDQMRIANALAAAADRWCMQEEIIFAFARSDAQNLPALHALENNGFRYVETTVTNTYDLRKLAPIAPEDWTIREVHPNEADILLDMAQDAFLTHRFYADNRFAPARVDVMYQEWVRNSLSDSAWTTIVLEERGQVNGFFIYRFEDLTPYFGLHFVKWRMAAIGSDVRGRGHGLKLFHGAMNFVRIRAAVVDSGLTLRNLRSLNLHNKLGFRVVCFSVTLHRWYR